MIRPAKNVNLFSKKINRKKHNGATDEKLLIFLFEILQLQKAIDPHSQYMNFYMQNTFASDFFRFSPGFS